MMKTWNIEIGNKREAISGDLLAALGYSAPAGNDETNTAKFDIPWSRFSFPLELAEAYAKGLSGNAAAIEAIRLREERRAANVQGTAQQKIAEINLKAAEEHRAAEGIAFARLKLARRES